MSPLSADRFALQVTIDRSTHDRLRHAQALLGHQLAPGDLAGVIERALEAPIERLEKRKFAATARPRVGALRASGSARHLAARVKREVWARDGGRCVFVSPSGHRCEARDRLEFDHVVEVSRGGEASAANLRLLCRAHNQFAAERTFGREFMDGKRRAAAEARRAEQARATRAREEAEAAAAADRERIEEVVPWLRSLDIRAADAHRAAEATGPMRGVTLEERVRAALAFHGAARQPGKRTGATVQPLRRSA